MTGKRAAELIQAEHQYLLQSYVRADFVIERGEGVYLYDSEGRRYLDFVAGIAVNALGYGDRDVLKAINDQAERLIHVSNLYHTQPAIELAKLLVQSSPAFAKAFFCNSGAEANEGAIKFARKYVSKVLGREGGEIISMYNAFHGRTLTTLSATPKPKYQDGFYPLPPGFKYVPFNDIEALKEAITDKTAAIMIEPVQGEGGIHVADKDYLKAVRDLCDDKNIVLIFDEVQCGMGRTGRMFAFEHYGVEPDILTLAKALGGGVPIGAVVLKEEIAKALSYGDHGTTFGGNPLACSAALASVEVIEELIKDDKVIEKGKYFIRKLENLIEKYNFIKEVRGLGLMIGAELEFNGADIVKKMLEKGFLINCTSDTVLRFLPPLIVEKEHIDALINALDEVFTEIKK